MNNLIKTVNNIVSKYYPVKIAFNKIHTLSHFFIESNNHNKFLPFNIDINGLILDGEYKNYKIVKVITNETLDWNNYILLYVSLLNNQYNPYVDENLFLFYLHTYNYLDNLHIKKVILQKDNNNIEYTIKYTNNNTFKLNTSNPIIIKNNNHFYFDSFIVDNNYKKLKIELDRLIKNRDDYSSIHFHLDNNGGGDIVPAHLILRCLVGKKESWMKNIKKMVSSKRIIEWDCWKEETKDRPNYNVIEKLNLNTLPDYDTKYNGKIYVYMDKKNGSAAWFFITYLIYAFSKKIKRFSKKCYGQTINFGSINSSQLKLIGHSGTTSGDGDIKSVKYKNIKILCPTEQFISSSIKNSDYNRFWIE